MDSRTQRNIDKLNEDLSEVHMVMTKNINEVLGQGEKLDTISRMTGDLAHESKKYHSKARDLSRCGRGAKGARTSLPRRLPPD